MSSAGTGALVGQPIWPPIAQLLDADGADSSHFAARRLDEYMLREADLVLALTRGHRAVAAETWPKGVRQTFTLKEFSRLVAQLTPAELPDEPTAVRLRAMIEWAASRRYRVADPKADDIVDPYRRDATVCRQAFTEIQHAAKQIAGVALGSQSFNDDQSVPTTSV